jgi:hypothetical protein
VKLHRHQHLAQRLRLGLPECRTVAEVGDVGDVALAFVRPEDVDVVSRLIYHNFLSILYFFSTVRICFTWYVQPEQVPIQTPSIQLRIW